MGEIIFKNVKISADAKQACLTAHLESCNDVRLIQNTVECILNGLTTNSGKLVNYTVEGNIITASQKVSGT